MAARAKQTRQKTAAAGSKSARAGAARPKREPAQKSAPKDRRAGADTDLAKRCEHLESELATARARIGELELRNEEAINRIDWVIDSLQTLLESQTKK